MTGSDSNAVTDRPPRTDAVGGDVPTARVEHRPGGHPPARVFVPPTSQRSAGDTGSWYRHPGAARRHSSRDLTRRSGRRVDPAVVTAALVMVALAVGVLVGLLLL